MTVVNDPSRNGHSSNGRAASPGGPRSELDDARLIDHALGFGSRIDAARVEAALARDPSLRDELEGWREVHSLLAERFEADPPGLERIAELPLPKARPRSAGAFLLRSPLRLPVRLLEALDDARLALEARVGAAFRPIVAGLAVLVLVAVAVALRRGSREEGPSFAATPSPSMTVTREIRTVVAEGGSVRMLAPDRMRLDAGAVWLWVKPGGRGFRVETPFGEVRVLGTSFGVTVSPKGLVVDVVEGRVAVGPRDGPDTSIGAGFRLWITDDGRREFADRPEGTELPYWVDALLEAGQDDGFATYLPSIGVHRGP